MDDDIISDPALNVGEYAISEEIDNESIDEGGFDVGDNFFQESEIHSTQSARMAVRCLLRVAELNDRNTYRHLNRVAIIADAIAREMKNIESSAPVRLAGLLHDIGKICIPFKLLGKADRLSENEMNLLQEHVEKGCDILENIEFPWPVNEVVKQHHERVDGSGYPLGLSGKQICIEARILAVADTLDAMSYQRPWRPGMGIGHSLEKMISDGLEGYDDEVIAVCRETFKSKGNDIRRMLKHYDD
ncbi:MAG: HD domain-containing protein [Candidatus Aegiribacteria sp.]|nr:HD domain-containing protein [Candidatus Aegiribacteria sp.]